MRFLEEITYFPKIVTVNDVQISPVKQCVDTATPMLAVRLSTTAFVLKGTVKVKAPQAAKPAQTQTAVKARGGEI